MNINLNINGTEHIEILEKTYNAAFEQALKTALFNYFSYKKELTGFESSGFVTTTGPGAIAIDKFISNKMNSPEFVEKVNAYVESNWQEAVNKTIIEALKDRLTVNKVGSACPTPYYFSGTEDKQKQSDSMFQKPYIPNRQTAPEPIHKMFRQNITPRHLVDERWSTNYDEFKTNHHFKFDLTIVDWNNIRANIPLLINIQSAMLDNEQTQFSRYYIFSKLYGNISVANIFEPDLSALAIQMNFQDIVNMYKGSPVPKKGIFIYTNQNLEYLNRQTNIPSINQPEFLKSLMLNSNVIQSQRIGAFKNLFGNLHYSEISDVKLKEAIVSSGLSIILDKYNTVTFGKQPIGSEANKFSDLTNGVFSLPEKDFKTDLKGKIE